MIATMMLACLIAGPADSGEARALFQTASRFFSAGRYAEAARTMERAYVLAPSRELGFSLAQAHRLQYFVDRDLARLERAVALYRDYVTGSQEGARRSDAVEFLAELSPILERQSSAPREPPPAPIVRTELLITTSVLGATVTIDGGAPVGLPVAAEVTPGPHRLLVEHDKYLPTTIDVVALQGRELPVEVELLPRPAELTVRLAEGGEVRVDGTATGQTGEPLSLTPGPHRIDVVTWGHDPQTVRVVVEPAERRELELVATPTLQRSLVKLGVGASVVAAVAAGILTGWALVEDGDAGAVLDLRAERALRLSELADYERHVSSSRDVGTAAGITAGAALVLGLVSVAAYVFDTPEPRGE